LLADYCPLSAASQDDIRWPLSNGSALTFFVTETSPNIL